MPLITGTQTDVLLRIEDHLDQKEALFVRLVNGQTVVNRMRHGDGKPEEDAVLVDDSWVAGLLSFRLRATVSTMNRPLLTTMVFNLAADNGERVLVLSDKGKIGLAREPDIQDGTRQGFAACLGKLEAATPDAISDALYKTGARVVVSDILPNLAFTLYNDVRETTGLKPVWVQLPVSPGHTLKRPSGEWNLRMYQQMQLLMNRGKIAIQVMTKEFA